MKTIATIYIDGQFVTPHGREPLVLLDPATERETTTVILADDVDAQRAIACAKAACPAVARTTREERMPWLQRLHDAWTPFWLRLLASHPATAPAAARMPEPAIA